MIIRHMEQAGFQRKSIIPVCDLGVRLPQLINHDSLPSPGSGPQIILGTNRDDFMASKALKMPKQQVSSVDSQEGASYIH